MSLWWVNRNQLDVDQIALIETLPLRETFLVLGPPGCGKTNVLLRRAQFVRGQKMPNVLVLTFTRALTEFVKTGCLDIDGREIFPRECVTTLESWARSLYSLHNETLPDDPGDLIEWKRRLALGAFGFVRKKRMPRYDALFVDEAQDLLQEEVELLSRWSDVLFFVGDDRQKIFGEAEGLSAVRGIVARKQERVLRFHYRLARPICRAADRVLLPHSGESLESTCHYKGPEPARVSVQATAQTKQDQLGDAATKLKEQVRVYSDYLRAGDRIGIIVARREDREEVLEYLERDSDLRDMVQIVRAREAGEAAYDPAFAPDRPICILTLKGCKGLEFRTVHWLFCDELSHHHGNEDYYTVITRAKTSLDIYYTATLPDVLARAHSQDGIVPW